MAWNLEKIFVVKYKWRIEEERGFLRVSFRRCVADTRILSFANPKICNLAAFIGEWPTFFFACMARETCTVDIAQ